MRAGERSTTAWVMRLVGDVAHAVSLNRSVSREFDSFG
jgi:hypothetical protein